LVKLVHYDYEHFSTCATLKLPAGNRIRRKKYLKLI
jgi:hypothetical protein